MTALPTHRSPLDPGALARDPIDQFREWYEEALGAGLPEPTAMSLATADAAGNPSVRIVLLKGYGPDGFVFFTHYESRKGMELKARPRAALALWWPALHRQIRIEGPVERVARDESDAYFHSRPRDSRLSAIVSPQSRPISSRAELEDRRRRLDDGLAGADPDRPDYWGGYRVRPERIEFWQMGEDRLHDRFLYRRDAGGWSIERLAP